MADLPGVEEAIPELSFPASPLDGAGEPVVDQEERPQLGHSWTSAPLTPMRIQEGAEPRAADEIAVDVAGTAHTYELVGLVADGGDGDLSHQHALYFPPEEAAFLADRGEGRVDGAGLVLTPGTEEAETVARVHALVSEGLAGDAPAPSGAESFLVAAIVGCVLGLLLAWGMVGLFRELGTVATALVGVFLVLAAVNALAVSASDRRSELASMRRLNLTTSQINAMVGGEMALTVTPAWLLGMGATAWMALAMAGGDVGAALRASPWGVLSLVGAFGLAVAVLGALLTTWGLTRSLPA